MSVASPIVETWDWVNRRIYLKQGVFAYNPIEDLYHEHRNQRRLEIGNARKILPLLRAEGKVPKGLGAFTPRYVKLLSGAKVVPYDESGVLSQLGDIITDDPDTDATIYDVSGLTVAKPIFIQPSESEIIQLNQADVEHSSFEGGVWFSPSSPNALGGANPLLDTIGSPRLPVNNLPDALLIQAARGLPRVIYVTEDCVLDTGDVLTSFDLVGRGMFKTSITINPGADTSYSRILDAYVTGSLDNNTTLSSCRTGNLTYLSGQMIECLLDLGTITAAAGARLTLLSCWSAQPVATVVNIDLAGTADFICRNWHGVVRIINRSSASVSDFCMGVSPGIVVFGGTFDASGGNAAIYGHGKLVGQGNAVLPVNDGFISGLQLNELHQNITTAEDMIDAMMDATA